MLCNSFRSKSFATGCPVHVLVPNAKPHFPFKMAFLGPAQGGNRLHVKREGHEDVLSRHQAPEAHLLKDAVECPLAAKLKKPVSLEERRTELGWRVLSSTFPPRAVEGRSQGAKLPPDLPAWPPRSPASSPWSVPSDIGLRTPQDTSVWVRHGAFADVTYTERSTDLKMHAVAKAIGVVFKNGQKSQSITENV